MADYIVAQKNVDGTLVVLSAPDHVTERAELLERAPFVRVTDDVVYIDAINPKLYRIVAPADKDGMVEMRKVTT